MSPEHRALGATRVALGKETTISIKPRAYARDWQTPTSFGVWGASAGDRSRLARALADRIDPEFYWFQVEDPHGTRDPAEDAVVSRIPSNRLFVLHPPDLAPHPELGNVASWVVREDMDADSRLRTLADFMRLPSLARNLLEGRSLYSPTTALVFANSDRAAAYYSAVGVGIRPFVEAVNEYAATPIFAPEGPSRPTNAGDVDYLFHLEGTDPIGGSTVEVECLQGAPPGTPGLFTVGDRRGLNALVEEIEHR